MNTLHQQLEATERVVITSIITGMGGIGKTELALQYARHYLQQKTYPGGVCWLEARGVDVGIQIINFARSQLNLNPPEDYDLQTQVGFCWRNWLQGNVLVIFDDVVDYEEILDFLPPGESRFKVLITTRHQWLTQSFHKLELQVLDEDAALELLVSFVGESRIQQELEEAKALCADLGFLPLGLELVARYLERKPDLSLAKARQRLKSKWLEHQSLERFSPDMTAERGVAAAFELSWQELNEDERELGRLLSLFAPAAIPWSLVAGCLPEVDEEDLEDRRDYRLVNLSLLQRVGEESYELHQLIREFFTGKLSESDSVEEMKRGICRVMVAVAKEIPETPIREQILAFEPAIPHLEEVGENLTDWLTDEDLILPFVGLGKFYKGQGFYQSAQPWFQKCLDINKSLFGNAHPNIATSFYHLGDLYSLQGSYEKAEAFHLKALEMRNNIFREAHLDIADSLNNLGLLYRFKGDYKKTESLYIEALEMRKNLLGDAHPDIAETLNNLGVLFIFQRRYEEAEPLLKEAFEMRKQLFGDLHLDITESLNNFAYLYYEQNRYDEAEPFDLQALEIRKCLLGEEHPSVAQSLNNLGNLYKVQKRYDKAESVHIKALEMRKHFLGDIHPDIANSLNCLGHLYYELKRYEEAESLYLEALEMRKRLLGETHPSTCKTLYNLAVLYCSWERYTEAETLYLEVLAIMIPQLGEQHPNTQTVERNYRIFLQQVLNENRQGELSDERSLQIISQMESDAEE